MLRQITRVGHPVRLTLRGWRPEVFLRCASHLLAWFNLETLSEGLSHELCWCMIVLLHGFPSYDFPYSHSNQSLLPVSFLIWDISFQDLSTFLHHLPLTCSTKNCSTASYPLYVCSWLHNFWGCFFGHFSHRFVCRRAASFLRTTFLSWTLTSMRLVFLLLLATLRLLAGIYGSAGTRCRLWHPWSLGPWKRRVWCLKDVRSWNSRLAFSS